jgi:hypothetical protein
MSSSEADDAWYKREWEPHTDGSSVLITPADRDGERATARVLEGAWRCSIMPFAMLCPVDFYAVRDARVCAVLELRRRTHAFGRFPTVYLSVRKWLALQMCAAGLAVPALFVVRFVDCLCFVNLTTLDTPIRTSIGGHARIVHKQSDIEPVFHIPLGSFVEIKQKVKS